MDNEDPNLVSRCGPRIPLSSINVLIRRLLLAWVSAKTTAHSFLSTILLLHAIFNSKTYGLTTTQEVLIYPNEQ